MLWHSAEPADSLNKHKKTSQVKNESTNSLISRKWTYTGHIRYFLQAHCVIINDLIIKPTICACVTAVHHTHTCHENHYMICKTIQHHAFGCKSQNCGCNTNLNAYTHKFVVIEGKSNKYTKTKSIAGFGIYQQG